MDNKGIIFCATQRSGSTMIVDLFEKLGYGAGREHFLDAIRKRRRGLDINWDDKIKRVLKKSHANGFHSIKIMANYLHHMEHFCSSGERTGLEDMSFPHFYNRFQDFEWIWIIRRNLAKQAISRYVARKTNIYHSTQLDGSVSFELIDIKEAELDKIIQKIAFENTLWQNFFNKNSIKYSTIYYEDLLKSSDYLTRILESLDIEYPLSGYGRVEEVKSNYKKLRTVSTEVFYEDYVHYIHNKLKVR